MNGTKEKSHPRLSSVFTHPLQFAYPNKLFHFLELMGRIRRFTSASSLPCVFVPSTPPNTWYLSVSSFPLRCGNISDMYLKAPAQEYSEGLIERRVRQWRRRNAKEETSFSAQPLIESVSHFARASEREDVYCWWAMIRPHHRHIQEESLQIADKQQQQQLPLECVPVIGEIPGIYLTTSLDRFTG